MKINTKIILLFLTTVIIGNSLLAWRDNYNDEDSGFFGNIFRGTGDLVGGTVKGAGRIATSPFPKDKNNSHNNRYKQNNNRNGTKQQQQQLKDQKYQRNQRNQNY